LSSHKQIDTLLLLLGNQCEDFPFFIQAAGDWRFIFTNDSNEVRAGVFEYIPAFKSKQYIYI
jgi:hypothetical protein